jgi:hypothetical protein
MNDMTAEFAEAAAVGMEPNNLAENVIGLERELRRSSGLHVLWG